MKLRWYCAAVALYKEEEEIQMISLSQALGKDVDFDWTVPVLCAGISEYFGVHLTTRALTQEEEGAICQIHGALPSQPEFYSPWKSRIKTMSSTN